MAFHYTSVKQFLSSSAAALILATILTTRLPASDARAISSSNTNVTDSSQTFEELKTCLNQARSMPNFDVQKMQGVWYTDTANQANDMVTCAMTRYDSIKDDDNKLFVTKFVQFRNGERQLIKPTIAWRFPADDALLMMHEGRNALESVALVTYVLDTDYNNYVVIYSCGVLGTGSVVRTAHIMTRATQSLGSAERETIIENSFGSDPDLTLGQRSINKDACPVVARSKLAQPSDVVRKHPSLLDVLSM